MRSRSRPTSPPLLPWRHHWACLPLSTTENSKVCLFITLHSTAPPPASPVSSSRIHYWQFGVHCIISMSVTRLAAQPLEALIPHTNWATGLSRMISSILTLIESGRLPPKFSGQKQPGFCLARFLLMTRSCGRFCSRKQLESPAERTSTRVV